MKFYCANIKSKTVKCQTAAVTATIRSTKIRECVTVCAEPERAQPEETLSVVAVPPTATAVANRAILVCAMRSIRQSSATPETNCCRRNNGGKTRKWAGAVAENKGIFLFCVKCVCCIFIAWSTRLQRMDEQFKRQIRTTTGQRIDSLISRCGGREKVPKQKIVALFDELFAEFKEKKNEAIMQKAAPNNRREQNVFPKIRFTNAKN